ncbi:hypothetical protein ACFRMQ_21355 [Kitasatospora sp. NPDC056783]|uniref:hypothetical protein n=1 Tax=Kitasatospora sp. NPDC056783 TaxID=3345943 RepID=UPI00368B4CA0
MPSNASNGTGLDAATAKSDQDAANALGQIPAAGTDPNSVKAWWNGLTNAQQQRMIPATTRSATSTASPQSPNPDHHVAFGRDPSVPQFGAQIIPTSPRTDHSGYWDPNSASLIAIGQAIAGKPIS